MLRACRDSSPSLLLSSVASLSADAQTPGKMDPAIEAAMKAAMPGPVHAELAKRAGTYTTLTKILDAAGCRPDRVEGHGPSVRHPGRPLPAGGKRRRARWDSRTRDCASSATTTPSQKYEGVWYYTGSTATMVLSGREQGQREDDRLDGDVRRSERREGLRSRRRRHSPTPIGSSSICARRRRRVPAGPRFETTYTRHEVTLRSRSDAQQVIVGADQEMAVGNRR